MNQLINAYSKHPVSYLISQRINQMILMYSKAEIRAAVYLLDAGLESTQHVIVMYLNNVINTYGLNALHEVLVLHGIDDSSLDFNIEDKAG